MRWTPDNFEERKQAKIDRLPDSLFDGTGLADRTVDPLPLRKQDNPIAQHMADMCMEAPAFLPRSMVSFGALLTGITFALRYPDEAEDILDGVDVIGAELGAPGGREAFENTAHKLFEGRPD